MLIVKEEVSCYSFSCPKYGLVFYCSGHAAYGSAVSLLDNKTRIGATYFMTYHSVLKSSKDFVDALRYARDLSDDIADSLTKSNASADTASAEGGVGFKNLTSKVFPYRSVFASYWLIIVCFLLHSFYIFRLRREYIKSFIALQQKQ